MRHHFRDFLLAFALCFSVLPVHASDARPSARIMIENVTVIPMDRDSLMEARDVLINGDRIEDIRPHGSQTPPADVRRFDASGRYLIPGLWDSHVHLTSIDHPGAPDDSLISEEAKRKAVEQRLKALLTRGVTSVRDPGMAERWIPLADSFRKRNDLPHLRFAGPVIERPGSPWSNNVEAFVDSPEEADRLVRKLAQSGVDFLKIYNLVSPDSFAKISETAREFDLPVAGHVPFAMSAREAVAGGMTRIEHAYVNLFKDCTEAGNGAMVEVLNAWVREGYDRRYRKFAELYKGRAADQCRELYAFLGERDVFVTATPQLDLPLTLSVGEAEMAALSAGARASCKRALAAQAEVQEASVRAVMDALTDHFRELRAAGVRLVAGSDAPTDCTSYGPALVRTIQLYADLGLSNREALASATVHAAQMARQDDAGAVRAGARADLVLLGANPLDDLAALQDVRAVMLRGKWVTASLPE
ncbi:Imidazolonepropionase [Parasphingorhabdus marina DSM 22363]|uniref:Imidazolonepropionase n=1 Tax=Parasphingorhabdus marina DSM 22363 TaxID=1123272 RepID=A0A1N6CMV9_9SPHN|nr:amidohydrolase family protein [Parasphingorhabdus marina]SIN59832.1 Imidazolonepropionase [Parasphingorhabdus marina DSM 22363]